MAVAKRRRLQPPNDGDPDLHQTACYDGLGTSGDSDAELIAAVGDRLSFLDANRLFTNQGAAGVYAESAWKSCADHSVLRINIEYRATPGTRTFIVAMRGHDDRAIYSRQFEPENLGLSGGTGGTSGDDLIQAGTFKAIGGGLDALDCRGMKSFKLILLAQGGGIAVDAWGGFA